MRRVAPRIFFALMLAGSAGATTDGTLSEEDVSLESATLQEALETTRTNDVSIWSRDGGDAFGTITPVADYHDAGARCRDYRKKVVVSGREEHARGAACRTSAGEWRVMREDRLVPLAPDPEPSTKRTGIVRERIVVQPIYLAYGYENRLGYAYGYAAGVPYWVRNHAVRSGGYSKLRFGFRADGRSETRGVRWGRLGRYHYGNTHGQRAQVGRVGRGSYNGRRANPMRGARARVGRGH